MASEDESNSQAQTEKGQKGGVLGLALPAVLAGGVAFAVSYFMPLDRAETESAEQTNESATAGEFSKETVSITNKDTLPSLVGAEKKPKSKSKKESPPEGFGLLKIDPIVISLAHIDNPKRRAPRLRLEIAVEASHAALSDPEVISLKLRNGFTATARQIPPDVLGGMEGLELLRAALLAHAQEFLGQDDVREILITDFLIT